MKFSIIVFLLFQITTMLWAESGYYQYINMKKRAYSLYEKKKSNEAINVVKKFIKDNPDSIRAQNLLAVLYYWGGEYKESKRVLTDILQKEKFPQSVALLKRVEKKISKIDLNNKERAKDRVVLNQNRVQKEEKQKIVYTKDDTKKINRDKQDNKDEILSVVKRVKENPFDIDSRKKLALYYDKIGNTKQAIYFAKEALKIDPDDREMINYLKSKDMKVGKFDSKDILDRALAKLDTFFKEKSYEQFMNLYNSLEHNNVVMPTQTHVDALYCAISLKQYEKAKSILHIYRMPKNRHIAEIRELVDEKLMLSRFASIDECEGGSCPVRR